jgi:heme/copper-type cytochrome/quinol oxidase subunit 2
MSTRNISIILALIVVAGVGYILLFGSPFNNPETITPTGVVQEFTMTAESFKFVPDVIEVNPGDTVVIRIQGLDEGRGNGHGFAVSDFNVNEQIGKDKTVTIEFIADKKGTFTFACSVPCDSGHATMKGKLVID